MSEIEESSGPEPIAEDGHEADEAPREGSLAWLKTRPLVDVSGLYLPDVHRVPDGGTISDEDDGRCRIVRPDGRRCRSPRLRDFGACLVHAGGGGFQGSEGAKEMSKRALAVKLARRERRELLGIGPRRAASARQIARVHAIERAEQLAAALVDGPLDDASLGSIERQQAALRAIDATFPLASVSAELSIPSDADGVAAMGWSEMRALAAQLLEDSS